MSDPDKNIPSSSPLGFLSVALIRDILVVLLLLVVGWKLAQAEWVVNLEGFGFAELLAMLLAFFAIGMSLAFYFKATDTSNVFYDNVYTFTKDTSEILGRIEAGFGERLRHIDEGYSGLQERFDRMPFDVTQAKEDVEKEEKEVERKEAERFELIDDLAKRAALAEDEKQKLFDELKSRDEELATARKDLVRNQSRMASAETLAVMPRGFSQYLLKKLDFLEKMPDNASGDAIQRHFHLGNVHRSAIADMRDAGLLDGKDDLTEKGIIYLRQLAREDPLE